MDEPTREIFWNIQSAMKVARATVKILQTAVIRFGILA
jgi:hypothetical protein